VQKKTNATILNKSHFQKESCKKNATRTCKNLINNKSLEMIFFIVYENLRQNLMRISCRLCFDSLRWPTRCNIRARKLTLAMRLVRSFFFSLCRKQMGARTRDH